MNSPVNHKLNRTPSTLGSISQMCHRIIWTTFCHKGNQRIFFSNNTSKKLSAILIHIATQPLISVLSLIQRTTCRTTITISPPLRNSSDPRPGAESIFKSNPFPNSTQLDMYTPQSQHPLIRPCPLRDLECIHLCNYCLPVHSL
jgi:hypothetical protein